MDSGAVIIFHLPELSHHQFSCTGSPSHIRTLVDREVKNEVGRAMESIQSSISEQDSSIEAAKAVAQQAVDASFVTSKTMVGAHLLYSFGSYLTRHPGIGHTPALSRRK